MDTTEDAGRLASPLTEGLGPLVERLLKYSDIRRNDPRENREALRDLIVGELADELEAVRKAERERCAKAAVAPTPLARKQIEAIWRETSAEVQKLEAAQRYTFAGWLPIAVRLVEKAHGIGA